MGIAKLPDMRGWVIFMHFVHLDYLHKLPDMRGWVTERELMPIRDTATQAHNGGFLPKRL